MNDNQHDEFVACYPPTGDKATVRKWYQDSLSYVPGDWKLRWHQRLPLFQTRDGKFHLAPPAAPVPEPVRDGDGEFEDFTVKDTMDRDFKEIVDRTFQKPVTGTNLGYTAPQPPPPLSVREEEAVKAAILSSAIALADAIVFQAKDLESKSSAALDKAIKIAETIRRHGEQVADTYGQAHRRQRAFDDAMAEAQQKYEASLDSTNKTNE